MRSTTVSYILKDQILFICTPVSSSLDAQIRCIAIESGGNGATGRPPFHFYKLCAAVCLDLTPYPGPGKLRSYAFVQLSPEQGKEESVRFPAISHGLEAQILHLLRLYPEQGK